MKLQGKQILALALCSPGVFSVYSQQTEKPNIIYIIADDLGYGDLGCYGQTKIQTPNIDKLAKEGMRFTQHYAGCTVSAPSRSSLMTGLHTGHTPIRGNKEHYPEGQHPLPANTYTIGRMLQENGYTTGCFGKWGLGYPGSEGTPDKQGFDEFYGYNCQRIAHNYYPYYLWHNQDTVWLNGNKGHLKEDYSHDLIQEQALEFIRSNKDKDKPFFAFLTYVIPHAELTNPEDSILARYKNTFPETPYKGVDDGTDYKTGGYGSTNHPKADFAAMITRLDAYVGEIMDLLKKSGMDKNTIVFFTSDNGPHREGGADPDYFDSYGPLRGVKRDLHEGGIRIPLIVSYPGKIKANSVNEHISAFWDILPTFAKLTGNNFSGNTDGISFLPSLLGNGKQKKHKYLYWEFHEEGGKMAVRKGNWKAIMLNVGNPEKSVLELYDLSKDIHEDYNVAEKYPKIVSDMRNIMQKEHVDSEIFRFSMPTIIK